MSFSLCKRNTFTIIKKTRSSSSQSILQDWEPLFASLRQQPLQENHPVFQGRRKEEPLSSAELQLLSDALNGSQSQSPSQHRATLSSQLRSSPSKNLPPLHTPTSHSQTQTKAPRFNTSITHLTPKTSNGLHNAANHFLDTKLTQLNSLSTPSQTWAWAEESVFSAWEAYEKKNLASSSSPSIVQSFQPKVYPLLVSHLMSTFRDRFKSPSMSLAVFRRASQQSPSSYVTACTTPVYNQLFATLWFVYGDVIAFADSLNEMVAAGIRLDIRTQAIINSITATYATALENVHNSFTEKELAKQQEQQEQQEKQEIENEPSIKAILNEAQDLDIEIPENILHQQNTLFSTSSSIQDSKVDQKLCFSAAERAAIAQIDRIAADSRAYHDKVSSRYRDNQHNAQNDMKSPPTLFRSFDPTNPIDQALL